MIFSRRGSFILCVWGYDNVYFRVYVPEILDDILHMSLGQKLEALWSVVRLHFVLSQMTTVHIQFSNLLRAYGVLNHRSCIH